MGAGDATEIAYLTADEAPIRGEIKTTPEDFRVEEIPAFAPSGTGNYVFFLLEKRGIATFEAIRRLARALDRSEEEFGYAGLKDARAVTRQILSVEGESPERLLQLDLPDLRIEWTERHGSKLRVGDLWGNRFTIRIRRTRPSDLPRVRRILKRLARHGLPNYYGPQRFGPGGRAIQLGRALLRRDWRGFLDRFLGNGEPGDPPLLATARARYREGDYEGAAECVPDRAADAGRALRALASTGGDLGAAVTAVSSRMLQLFVSSLQSHLFNRVVTQRIDSLSTVEEGDVAVVHSDGSCYVVEDASREKRRAAAFEISPSGPIVGWRLLRGYGRPRAIEDEVFEEEGVLPESFRDLGPHLNQRGVRRPLRVPVVDSRAEWWEDALVLSFSLPKGSYATTVIGEILTPRSHPREGAGGGGESGAGPSVLDSLEDRVCFHRPWTRVP
jgi:tRNA pseudouridine13 synthase